MIEVRHVNVRMMLVVIAIESKVITVLLVCALQCVYSTEAKRLFYNNLSVEMLKVHGKYVLLGHFNGYVGKGKIVMERVLKFAGSFKLKIVNTWYKKMCRNC